MDIDEFLSRVKSGGSRDRPGSERREVRSSDIIVDGSRKRPKPNEDEVTVVKAGIMKRPNLHTSSVLVPPPTPAENINETSSGGGSGGGLGDSLEISEVERLRILQMVEDEPEVS